MELPKKVHPTRVAWKYISGYLKGGTIALLSLALIALWEMNLFGVQMLAPAMPEFIPLSFGSVILSVLALPLFYGLYIVAKTEYTRLTRIYTFYEDRVVVQTKNYLLMEEESDDIPYKEITNVWTIIEWQAFFRIGRLKIIMAGFEEPIYIHDLRNPHPFEKLLLGEDPENIAMGEEAEVSLEDREERLKQQLSNLRQQYEDGEFGQAEYEEQYYTLKGELEELQREEEIDEAEREEWEEKEAEDIREEMERVEQEYEAGNVSREEYERRYYFLKGELEMVTGD